MTRYLILLVCALAFAGAAQASTGEHHPGDHHPPQGCFRDGRWQGPRDCEKPPPVLVCDEVQTLVDGRCVDVTPPPPAVEPPAVMEQPHNAIAECYGHGAQSFTMIGFGTFQFLTTAPQPELGGRPYWTTGFQASVEVRDGVPVGFTCATGTPTGTWYDTSFFPQDHAAFVATYGLETVDALGPAAVENYRGVTIP